MANNILISVNLVNKGRDNFRPETLLIPDDIAWIDFECLLKAHLDQENITVKYVDADNDVILISTNDEMKEAVKVAKSFDSFLNVKVFVHDSGLKIDSPEEEKPVPKPRTTEAAPAKKVTQEEPPERSEKLHEKLRSVQHLLEETEKNHTEETGEVDPSLLNTDQETGTITVKKLKGIKKRDIYAVVASDISADLASIGNCDDKSKKRPKAQTKLGKKKATDSSPSSLDVGACAISMRAPLPDQNVPYHLFVEYMEKLKHELRTEIVQDVTRKTVKHVLKGLEGSPHSKQTSPQPQHTHEGIVCKHCEKNILGVRYICGNCPDYDLCESCEAKDGVHEPTHVFLKLRVPCSHAGIHEGQRRAILKRNIYSRRHMKVDAVISEPASLLEPNKDRILRKIAKVEEKFRRKDEKLQRREEKLQEKIRRKEEKLKRKLETQGDRQEKREKLDLPQFRKPYFDFVDLGADFIGDDTIPDGTQVQPGTKLVKTWRLKNTGKIAWTSRTKIRLLWGGIPAKEEAFSVPLVEPGTEGAVSVMLTAPQDPGKYQSHWKLDESGYSFGSRLWCSIVVEPKEVLEPTAPERSDSLLLMDSDHFAEKQEHEPASETPESNEEWKSPVGADHETEIQPVIDQPVEQEIHIEESKPADDSIVKDVSDVTLTVAEEDSIAKDLSNVALAVAQLKVSDTEEEPSRDLLSFEMVDKDNLKPSQTGTPSNTPMGLPSPKSEPTSVEQTLSTSSSVEVVGEKDGNETDESYDMAEYVRDRIQSLGLKPDIDLEYYSSSDDEYDDSSDASDDFYVVPLPDCFDTSKPLTRSMIEKFEEPTAVIGDKDKVLSLEPHLEATNSEQHSKSLDTLTETTVAENAEENASMEPVTEIQPTQENNKDATDSVQSCDNDSSLTMEKKVPEDINNSGAEAASNVTPPDVRPKRQDSNPGVELVDQFMATAVHAATKAAVQVYSTCKGVMSSIQQKNDAKVTYPQKEWTPPQSDFKMPEDNFTLPEDKYEVPRDTYEVPRDTYEVPRSEWQPPKPATPQDRLKEMGFCNKERNAQLLSKYNDDVERVVQELLNESENTYGKDR